MKRALPWITLVAGVVARIAGSTDLKRIGGLYASAPLLAALAEVAGPASAHVRLDRPSHFLNGKAEIVNAVTVEPDALFRTPLTPADARLRDTLGQLGPPLDLGGQGGGHQEQGDHEQALGLFETVLTHFPDFKTDKQFRKLVQTSEEFLGRETSLVPKPSALRPIPRHWAGEVKGSTATTASTPPASRPSSTRWIRRRSRSSMPPTWSMTEKVAMS